MELCPLSSMGARRRFAFRFGQPRQGDCRMSNFQRMKDDLIARGMIDVDGRVTPAGAAYTDRVIAELKTAAATEPSGRAVAWDTRRVKVRT